MADDSKGSALTTFSGTFEGTEGFAGFKAGVDYKFTFGVDLPWLVDGRIPTVFLPQTQNSGGGINYDESYPPGIGELLVRGPSGVIGRSVGNFWDLFAKKDAITFATPFIVNVGAVITQLRFDVTVTSNFTLGNPLGTPGTLVPGLRILYVITNAASWVLSGVPVSWSSIQPEIPAIALGAGKKTRILMEIETVTIEDDEVTITAANYTILPGPE